MEALVCKNCGSNDIEKNGDFFICQHCGTKHYIKNNVVIIVANTTGGKQSVSGGPVNVSPEVERKAQETTNKIIKWGIMIIVGFCLLLALAPSKPNKEVSKYELARRKIETQKARLQEENVKYNKPLGKFAGLTNLEMLSLEGHPRLFDSVDKGLEFFRDMGNRNFYFKMLGDEDDLFGESSSQMLQFEGVSASFIGKNGENVTAKKITYISSVRLYFFLMKPEQKVGYETAIRIADGYIPKDILRKYYKLSYRNKYVPSDDRFSTGEILYVLANDENIQKEARSFGLPEKCRITFNFKSKSNYVYSIYVDCSSYDEERHIQRILNKGYTLTKWDYDPLKY